MQQLRLLVILLYSQQPMEVQQEHAALTAITTIDRTNGVKVITLSCDTAVTTVNFTGTCVTVQGTLPAAYTGKATRTIVGSAIITDNSGQKPCVVEVNGTTILLRIAVPGTNFATWNITSIYRHMGSYS